MAKLRNRFILSYLVFGLVPLAIIGFLIISISQQTLQEEIVSHLQTTATDRASKIEAYLFERRGDVFVLSQIPEVISSISERRTEGIFFKEYKEVYGYSDLYLIDSSGNIFYSVEKKSDFRTNLEQEDTNLARLYEEVKNEQRFILSDYEFYEPSNGPASFIAAPVFKDANFIGVIALEININQLNDILYDRTGLGESGETYLVGKDYFMRSDSRFFEESTILKQKVSTENAIDCFNRRVADKAVVPEIVVFPDYRGVPVLGTNIYIPETGWCLLAEIDEAEAFAPIPKLRNTFILIGLFLAAFLIPFSFLASRSIMKPIMDLKKANEEVEKGNFKARVDIKTGDELGSLGDSFNRTSEALGKINEEHKQLDKAKTEFLSITSHELRSPMTPMKAQLQMLERGYFGNLNKKQKESVSVVLRNTTRLDTLISDMLEISRIEAARLKFVFKKVDLADSIKTLVKDMKGFMPEKKINLIEKIGKLPIIEVDPDRVGQVLRNLINNAIKFTPEKGKVEVTAEAKKDHILISVKDTGIGISGKDKERIFEPFYQAEQTMYRKKGGTGLGLAICRGIIESQKGKLWIESKETKGSTFYFTVPFTPVREIKPIRVLFSEKANIEKKLEEKFREIFGPIGTIEFQELKMKTDLTEDNLLKYIESLKIKRIIDENTYQKAKRELLEVMKGEPAISAAAELEKLVEEEKLEIDYKKFIQEIIYKTLEEYGQLAVDKANHVEGLNVGTTGKIIKIGDVKKVLNELSEQYISLIGKFDNFITEKNLREALLKNKAIKYKK